jgi:hypothetical protein
VDWTGGNPGHVVLSLKFQPDRSMGAGPRDARAPIAPLLQGVRAPGTGQFPLDPAGFLPAHAPIVVPSADIR